MPDGTNSTILLLLIARPLPALRSLPVNIAVGDLSHKVWFYIFKFSYYYVGMVEDFALSSDISDISKLIIFAQKPAR
jgi:hypothetical protein